MAAIEKFARIFATMVPAFFWRLKPISRKANPACMNMTRTPATITQMVSMPTAGLMAANMEGSLDRAPGHVVVSLAKDRGSRFVQVYKRVAGRAALDCALC